MFCSSKKNVRCILNKYLFVMCVNKRGDLVKVYYYKSKKLRVHHVNVRRIMAGHTQLGGVLYQFRIRRNYKIIQTFVVLYWKREINENKQNKRR